MSVACAFITQQRTIIHQQYFIVYPEKKFDELYILECIALRSMGDRSR